MLRVAGRCSFRQVRRCCIARAALAAHYHSTPQRSRRRSLPTIPIPQYDYTAEEELTEESLQSHKAVERNVSDAGQTAIVSVDASAAEIEEEVEVESSSGDKMNPSHTPTWFELGLCEDMRIVMKKAGLRRHSNAAQAECLPNMMEGCNMLIHALPGSGLTTAYCVMICDRAVRSLCDRRTPARSATPDSRVASTVDPVVAPGVLTSEKGLRKLRALQGTIAIGARTLILVRNSVQVKRVAELFNKYFGNAFQACAMHEASDMVVNADTAVLVTTPPVALAMDLATLTRRVDTIILDGVCQSYVLTKLFALPPPMSTAPALDGGGGGDLPARQIVGIVRRPVQFGRAGPAFWERDAATVQLRAPFQPQAFRRPAFATQHSFMRVANESDALRVLIQRLLRAVPGRAYKVELTPALCQRVLIVANRQVSPEALANLWSAIKEPAQLTPTNRRPWFARFHAMTASRHQWRAYDLFRNASVPLLLTTQDFVAGVPTFGNVDLVIMYGMPEPLDYFMACRHVEARNGKVMTIHDDSRAELAVVLQQLVVQSPDIAESLHNDITAQLISTPFSMDVVRKWQHLARTTSAKAMNQLAQDCMNIDELAERVSQRLYTKTMPRSGGQGTRRF